MNSTARYSGASHLVASLAVSAPVIFAAAVMVQAWQIPDYSHVTHPISALAAWPRGWVQSLNFGILAAGMFAFAALMNRAVRRGPTGVAGSLLLAVCGVGLVLAAAFPWAPLGDGFAVPRAHVVGAGLTFCGAGGGLTILSRRMMADAEWERLAPYTLVSGLGVLLFFIIILAGARSDGDPLRSWLGLLQRLALVLWLPCVIALAWHALRRSVQRVVPEQG
jgi:hypothetical protein